MKIFLDDDPRRDHWVDDTWTIVRTVPEAFFLLSKNRGKVEVLSLDHDLGDDTPTGYDLVRHLEMLIGMGDKWFLPERFEIHSANPVGRRNMQAGIDSIERMRNA